MNLFKKIAKIEKTEQEQSMTTISRVETINGFSIPGIIFNMQYHFTNLQIYSDGLIDCWEMVDLPMFQNKLNKNWVVTSIPDGKTISIFSLGNWVIENGEWDYNQGSYYNYIKDLVKKLNPTLENLHNYNGKNFKLVGEVRVAKHPYTNFTPYYLENPESIFPNQINGERFYIFYINDDKKTYLAELSIYKNGQIEITNIPKKKIFKFDDLKTLINDEKLITELKIGEKITILGLGSFIIKSGNGVNINSKYDEFLNKYQELNGIENSIAKCARIFEEYKSTPTVKLKSKLKEAYENVPEHNRMFVGDMDTKDYEVRQIIYGDIVKKEWEDYYGYEYPYPDMPKPIDE
ncbi:DUF7638 domain-containing protein [Flavobacterium mesophilum]|uniref:DUF7638 domain-containing protein n=1 Tax=Flavobacterium mesophilum TaxID=3143495 RepID=UPI0031D7F040